MPSPDHQNLRDPSNHERTSCLVLHGLGGGPYELEPLTSALRAVSLPVLAPVLPGHDGPGPRMPASRWEDWTAAVEMAFDELAATGERVAVIGFSTGATLALHLATRRPVDRLVLLAPFLAIRYSRWMPIRAMNIMRPLARFVPSVPRRPKPVCDRAMRKWAMQVDPSRTFSL